MSVHRHTCDRCTTTASLSLLLSRLLWWVTYLNVQSIQSDSLVPGVVLVRVLEAVVGGRGPAETRCRGGAAPTHTPSSRRQPASECGQSSATRPVPQASPPALLKAEHPLAPPIPMSARHGKVLTMAGQQRSVTEDPHDRSTRNVMLWLHSCPCLMSAQRRFRPPHSHLVDRDLVLRDDEERAGHVERRLDPQLLHLHHLHLRRRPAPPHHATTSTISRANLPPRVRAAALWDATGDAFEV